MPRKRHFVFGDELQLGNPAKAKAEGLHQPSKRYYHISGAALIGVGCSFVMIR